jgi:metal-sulfur cluster biosynthetic enzyme
MNSTSANEITEAMVMEALGQVDDPELGVSIVDLGLIYGIRIEGGKVSVTMTLTTRGCPLHESIGYGVRLALLQIEPVREAEVEIVWDPPWHPGMMTDRGRAAAGTG